MTEKTNQINSPNSNGWKEKMFRHLKSIFDGYVQKFPQYEEFLAFMNNENLLYDENNRPSEEYKKWIEKVDTFCRENPLELVTEELGKDKIEVLLGAKDFLDKQKELMKSLRESSDKEAWVDSELDSEEKREAFDKLVEESTNNTLNNVESK